MTPGYAALLVAATAVAAVVRPSFDFVDFQTLNVFPDAFESSAWTPVVHAFAGIDISLGQYFVLTGESRYTWAKGPMGRDFVGFKNIDLSALSVTAGFSLRL